MGQSLVVSQVCWRSVSSILLNLTVPLEGRSHVAVPQYLKCLIGSP